MFISLFLILAWIATVVTGRNDSVGATTDEYKIWPLPKVINYQPSDSDSIICVAENITFISNAPANGNNSILDNAFERYKKLIFPHKSENTPNNTHCAETLSSLQITVTFPNQDSSPNNLEYGTVEDYTLTIVHETNVAAMLESMTIWGTIRGLETFSQIIIYNFTLGYYTLSNDFKQLQSLQIIDSARFMHRGLMLDTSRHFEPVSGIKQLLLAMSYNKLNVFHWHMTDAESFPYLSNVLPQLGLKGSFNKISQLYTTNDVLEVKQFAYMLGIRVIVEFDMPGHSGSWCLGYPDICPSPECVEYERETNVENIPLNPASNMTYQVIEQLLSEVVEYIDDDFIHLGGDETVTYCWTQTDSIVDWMNKNNFTTSQAYMYFITRVHQIASGVLNKNIINWVEVFESFYDYNNNINFDSSSRIKDEDDTLSISTNNTIIQVWKNKTALSQVINQGFRAILSNDDKWYLNDVDVTWKKMYLNEPFTHPNINDKDLQELVLGGEGCMWGEYVDQSDLQSTVWPRMSAIAERLWSDRSVNSTRKAEDRLEYFRCLMNMRGISAAPTDNRRAREAPSGPGSCYDQ